jgi:hypothetical protein
MDQKTPSKSNILSMPSMEYPAMYRIRIRGRLDHSWSERLGGMSITTTGGRDTAATTLLEGKLLDQADLTGVLNALYDLRLPLISVEYFDSTNSESKLIKI